MKTSSRPSVLALTVLLLGTTPVFASESNVAADRPATVASTVTPAYPYLLRRAEAKAEVTVSFTVNAQGIVTKASVIDTNNPEFNAPTLDAIKQWTFTPATRNGKAVDAKLLQTFTFTVRDKASGAPVMVADKKAR